MHPASKYTRVTSGQTDASIEGGDNFWCHAIVVTSDAGATAGAATTVTVEEADGSTVILPILVAANTTQNVDVAFMAHKGMTITTGASVTCTVFHEHAGR